GGCQSRTRRDQRWSGWRLMSRSARGLPGGELVGELRKLRKRLPARHPFAPTEVAWKKTPGSNSFANLFLRKCAEACCAPTNVNHRHTGVLVSAASKVNLLRRVRRYRVRARNTRPRLSDEAAIFHPASSTV